MKMKPCNSLIACKLYIFLSSLQHLANERNEVNFKPRPSFGHIVSSSYALTNSGDQEPAEPRIEPVVMAAGKLAPTQDTAPSDASINDVSCKDEYVSCGDESGIDGEAQPAEDGLTDDSIALMGDLGLPFEVIIRKVVTARFTSYMNAVSIMIDVLSDAAIYDILLQPGTSLLAMCRIADTNARAQCLAALAFRIKYADRSDIREEISAWKKTQIARFYELFGESMAQRYRWRSRRNRYPM